MIGSTSQPDRRLIRFQLPAEGEECLAFTYSPLLEAVLSLHVLVEPKHHPLQHEWVRRMRALPPGLRRRIRELAFAYDRVVPEFLMPSPAAGYASFEEELGALSRLDGATAGLGFLRLLWDHGGERDEGLLADRGVRAAVAEKAAALGVDARLAATIFDDPHALLARLSALLAAYWEAAFAAEWERLEPELARTVSDAGAAIARSGLYAYLRGLSPALLIDAEARELRRRLPHEHDVEITAASPLVLVPSWYVWPHVRVSCDPPWPHGIVYPAPFAAAETRVGLPAAELVHVLRALGDPTRLRALKLIAAKPRSTQELAPLVGISEAGLSKHLRQLARAGIVEPRREGYYVVYSLAHARIEALSEALLEFLA
jgi:DNA-binding transcriptional ArsR family regulator